MSLEDYPNQSVVFSIKSCTKLRADTRVRRMKWWLINENSLYVYTIQYVLPELAVNENPLHGQNTTKG